MIFTKQTQQEREKNKFQKISGEESEIISGTVRSYFSQKIKGNSILLILLFLMVFIIFCSFRQGCSLFQSLLFLVVEPDIQKELPINIWLRTEQDYKRKVVQYALIQHIKDWGNKEQLKVHEINDFNAFKWYSTSKKNQITQAIHKTKFQYRSTELNTLAVLIEQGGIYIQPSERIFLDGFKWVFEMFERRSNQINIKSLSDPCLIGVHPQLLFFGNKQNGNVFSTSFIAARPNSRLLINVDKQIKKALLSGSWPYNNTAKNIKINQITSAKILQRPFINLLNIFIQQQLSDQDQCEAKKAEMRYIFVDFSKVIQKNKLQGNFQAVLYHPISYFLYHDIYALSINDNQLQGELNKVISTGNIMNYKNSPFGSVIQTPSFQNLTIPKTKKRAVHLCIASLKPASPDQISMSYKELKRQTLTNWSAVYFTTSQMATKIQTNLKIKEDRNSQGLNLLEVSTKLCPNKSIIVLLDYDERFLEVNSLQKISSHFQLRETFAGFSILVEEKDGKNVTHSLKRNFQKFRRQQNQPNKQNLEWIRNHLRVFNSEMYKFIPHYDMHNSEGQYYDRLAFFQTMLQLASPGARQRNQWFPLRLLEEKMDVPEYTKDMEDVTILIKQYEILKDLKKQHLSGKNPTNSLESNLQYQYSLRADPTQLFILNENGFEFKGPKHREHLPKIIPKKIHQIWVKGSVPSNRKILMNQNKRKNPNFQHYVWGEENITKENFPYTYNALKTILEFDKVSTLNLLSTVADYMRIEIIYWHGGFFIDSTTQILKQNFLQRWRTYKLVLSGEIFFYDRITKMNGFFASVEKNPILLRMIEDVALNTRVLFARDINMESGPGFITRLVVGKEEFDSEILLLSPEHFCPNISWPPFSQRNKCLIQNPDPKDSSILFWDKNKAYRKDCNTFYPFSVGIKHFEMGGSWLNKRQKK